MRRVKNILYVFVIIAVLMDHLVYSKRNTVP